MLNLLKRVQKVAQGGVDNVWKVLFTVQALKRDDVWGFSVGAARRFWLSHLVR